MVIRRKRRSSRRKSRRSNPRYGKYRPTLRYTRSGWKRPKRSRLMRRPTRVNRRRRRTRRNPALNMRTMFSQQKIMTAVGIGTGIVASAIAMPVVYNVLPAGMKAQRKFLGAVHVITGLVLTSLVRNKTMKTVGLVVAGTGIYDLVAQNIPQLGLAGLPTSNILIGSAGAGAGAPVSASYTPGLMGASYNVPTAPVSSVAGLMGASYSAPGSQTAGLGCDLSGTNPFEGMDW